MTKYVIPPEKRYAVWKAHKYRCQFCKKPPYYDNLTVDHIIPEFLLQSPKRLSDLLKHYELGTDFALNSYQNWLPAHSKCNRDKWKDIPDKAQALFFIGIAKSKAEKAEDEERKHLNKISVTKTVLALKTLQAQGMVSQNDIRKTFLKHSASSIDIESRDNVLVVTFALAIDDVVGKAVPEFDHRAQLYEWLEEDLIGCLEKIVSVPFFRTEPSHRDGEAISVRFGFDGIFVSEFDHFHSPWWGILEMQYYHDLYQGLDAYDDWMR